jgi:hypothetical protein
MMVALTHPLNDQTERIFVVLKALDHRSHLKAYMDDSGSHNGAQVSVIAGYFGGHKRWDRFDDRWAAVLRHYGVGEFHAKPFWARDSLGRRVGEYKAWSDERADSFIDELLRIIEESTRIFPFACAVENEEWKKQTEDDQLLLSGASLENPIAKPTSKSMFLAFQRCVVSVAAYCKAGIRAHYIFDDDHGQNSVWAASCYGELKMSGAAICSSIGQLVLADSIDATPLQAADLLAYEARTYGEYFLTTKRDDMRETYIRALRNMRSKQDFWLFEQKRLDSLLRRMGAVTASTT